MFPFLRFVLSKISMSTPPPSSFIFGLKDHHISVSLCPGQLSDPDNRRLATESRVRRVTQLKEKSGASHELILVDVSYDTPHQSHSTFVQIDRYGKLGPLKSSSPVSATSLSDRDTGDLVWLPGSRTRASYTFDQYTRMLCNERGYQLIRTATLSAPHMSVAQLLIMAKTLHDEKQTNDIFKTQHAGMLVDMIEEEFGAVVEEHDSVTRVGKFKSAPITTVKPTVKLETVREVLEKYRIAWQAFCDRDDGTATTELNAARAEIDRLNEEAQRATKDAQRARDELTAYKLGQPLNSRASYGSPIVSC